ncbi:putative metal-binding motif-containing protein [Ulvibacter antarcticus]|uniref:Putative metal-binding protein n=1 Tax=Ulvibacter antarcticus TaxID=442714 RepID=A0A3L9YEU6_9FLAO|nr:putative metal-binding motif-containing protein [Ulvibacter antarcticus]RMA58914.1 putative metal-binding protein [Ulvibacter antarcticus]
MKKLIFLLVFLFIAFACSKDNDEVQSDLNADSHTTLSKKGDKVDICHRKGNGTWHVINVSSNALAAHLAHGDVQLIDEDGDGFVTELNECVPGGDCDDTEATTFPGAEEICGDGIDNNCDGDIDEDCCPYFTVDEIVALGANYTSYYNFNVDPCITEETVAFQGTPCTFGLSYDVALYGDTIVVDLDCNSYVGIDIMTLNACEDVLVAAQAILNKPNVCSPLQAGTIQTSKNANKILGN